VFALDTNTVSYYFRGDPQVVPRMHALPPARLLVPSVVVYELRYGLLRLPPAAAQPRLEALDTFLEALQVLDFDEGCAQVAASLRVHLEGAGSPIGPHDLLIAATALRHRAALVTRNVAEFSRVPGLEVVNWHDVTP
jgi:tRNA(fMet)-specific endonuclease VapC